MNDAFYKLFNSESYLPTIVVYFLDDDLYMGPELFLPSEVESHLRWIFSDFDQALKTRKRGAPQRSYNQGQPQSYVLKALPRCDVGTDPNYLIFEERFSKFNNLLYAIGRCYSIGTINIQTLQGDDTRNYKSTDGASLDIRGHYKLWREILSTLYQITKDMEHEKRRRMLQEEAHQKRSNGHDDRRRLSDNRR